MSYRDFTNHEQGQSRQPNINIRTTTRMQNFTAIGTHMVASDQAVTFGSDVDEADQKAILDALNSSFDDISVSAYDDIENVVLYDVSATSANRIVRYTSGPGDDTPESDHPEVTNTESSGNPSVSTSEGSQTPKFFDWETADDQLSGSNPGSGLGLTLTSFSDVKVKKTCSHCTFENEAEKDEDFEDCEICRLPIAVVDQGWDEDD